MSTMKEKTRQLKLDSPKLAALSEDIRNAALLAVADALVANKDAIFAANQKDLKKAEEDNLDMVEALTGVKVVATVKSGDETLDMDAEELAKLYQ